MNIRIDDINIKSIKQLVMPVELMEQIPITNAAIATITQARTAAKNIIKQKDDRLLVIVGPCSVHNIKAAHEYGQLLKTAISSLSNELCIIMRVYFEKPRTSIGWKGLINDPHLDNSFDINCGLKIARQLLLDLNDQGIPAGSEFLDTTIPQYISDLISWGAIGARTTESQIHRELASGLSMPIGFKNGTDGNVDVALDAIYTASFSHHFLGITKSGRAAILETAGNHDCHIILRGGNSVTNYDGESIRHTCEKASVRHLTPRGMVDCSHGNSNKNYKNQIIVADDICKQIHDGSTSICGVMLESHLTEGKQAFSVGQKAFYDKSITDACLSWEQTKPILHNLAAAVKMRRKKS